MPFRTPQQITEFFAAITKPYSYNLRSNIYIWFGFLWGLPIPVVTVLMQYRWHLAMIDPSAPISAVLSSPRQWFFLLHPVMFGLIFGILGTIRNEKDAELARTIRQLKDISTQDPLTGLKNRRFFAHNFHDECARSLRRKEALSLLFIDIDHFKQINDKHGHHVGDSVLKELADYLKLRCRPYDTPVRWGGEEFLILLRATDETQATLFAERIRLGIEAGFSSNIPLTFTVSIGLAQYHLNDTLEELCDRADRALYHAKQTGRNRVISWSTLPAAIRL